MTSSGSYQGRLYRALHPRFASDPLSGAGASLYGGRFNPIGTPALYTSIAYKTAILESKGVGELYPTVLVSFHADIQNIFDGRDKDALKHHGFEGLQLGHPGWRDDMRRDGLSSTQRFAVELISRGFHALLVPSFASGAAPDDINLVLWSWGPESPNRLDLIDEDDGRLQALKD